MKKVAVSGGATLTLSRAPIVLGATWGPNDMIVVSPINTTGLFQVSAAGGAAQPLTTLKEGELSHRWPAFLPGGKAILFAIANAGNPEGWQIAVQRFDTGERKILVRGGSHARYVPTGHLVYYRSGTIMAARFDLARLEVMGTPAPVLEGVMSSAIGSGAGQYSVSSPGSLIYVPGSGQARADLTMVWVDRKGTAAAGASALVRYTGPLTRRPPRRRTDWERCLDLRP